MKTLTPFSSPQARCIATCLLVTAAWLASPGPAAAAPAPARGDLDIKLVAQRVLRDADGQEALQPAERAFPGDVIQYDATYHNRADKGIANVAPTLPIPTGMEYVPDSAKPAPALASLDGKLFEPIPLKRQVILPSGEVQEQEVPATEYRALRWNLGEMEAGGRTTVVARARLLPAGRASRLTQN